MWKNTVRWYLLHLRRMSLWCDKHGRMDAWTHGHLQLSLSIARVFNPANPALVIRLFRKHFCLCAYVPMCPQSVTVSKSTIERYTASSLEVRDWCSGGTDDMSYPTCYGTWTASAFVTCTEDQSCRMLPPPVAHAYAYAYTSPNSVIHTIRKWW